MRAAALRARKLPICLPDVAPAYQESQNWQLGDAGGVRAREQKEVYIRALAASREMYSRDGRFVEGAMNTAYQVLKVFDPSVANAKIDLSRTFETAFVQRALAAN
jgi:hypothetical protein